MPLTTRYDGETGVFWVVLKGQVHLGEVLQALENLKESGYQHRIWDAREAVEHSQEQIARLTHRLREFTPPGPGRSALLTASDRKSTMGPVIRSHVTTPEVRFDVFDDPAEAIEWVTTRPNVGKGETILVAEDQELVRELLGAALKRAGYRVVTVTDGLSGWEKIEELEASGSPVDLVVADVVMPVLSGIELAERVLSAYPRTRVIFISGYQDRDTPAGAVVLKKPFGYDDLLVQIREALNEGGAG